MRPHRYYVCFDNGFAFAVHKGMKAALRACGGRRSYVSFRHQIEAEEFAAWFNYTKERTA